MDRQDEADRRMIKPLAGIRVVDLSRALAGSYCTALLADLGAEIIKVESLNGGDIAHQWPSFQNDHSLYFDSVNRNKRSVVLIQKNGDYEVGSSFTEHEFASSKAIGLTYCHIEWK